MGCSWICKFIPTLSGLIKRWLADGLVGRSIRVTEGHIFGALPSAVGSCALGVVMQWDDTWGKYVENPDESTE